MNKLKSLAPLVLFCLALAGPIQADVVNINQTIDLEQWVSNGYNYPFGSTPYVISNGDTVSISYSFANNLALQLTNPAGFGISYTPAWPWLLSNGNYGTFGLTDITTTLTAPVFTGGSGTSSVFQASETSQTLHLGAYSSFMVDGNTSVSFTGITSTFTVDYLPGDTNSYVTWFGASGLNQVQIAVVDRSSKSSSVPDAGTTSLLLGLGMTGLIFVRRLVRT